MTNRWKIVAIILIITNIFLLAFIGYFWKIGTEVVNNENKCAINICEGYDAYHYDYYENICYCYNNHEIKYQEFMG